MNTFDFKLNGFDSDDLFSMLNNYRGKYLMYASKCCIEPKGVSDGYDKEFIEAMLERITVLEDTIWCDSVQVGTEQINLGTDGMYDCPVMHFQFELNSEQVQLLRIMINDYRTKTLRKYLHCFVHPEDEKNGNYKLYHKAHLENVNDLEETIFGKAGSLFEESIVFGTRI